MKLIIAGSRNLRVSYNFIKSKFVFFEIPLDHVDEIVTGKAHGIDFCGEQFAIKERIPHKGFPYKPGLGRAGGPVRNREMAEYVKGRGALLLIWDGVSKGSASMKFEAKRLFIPVFEVILHRPKQAEMKNLGIYKDPKDRVSEVNRSNTKDQHPGAIL